MYSFYYMFSNIFSAASFFYCVSCKELMERDSTFEAQRVVLRAPISTQQLQPLPPQKSMGQKFVAVIPIPMYGTLLGLICGLIPPIRSLIFEEGAIFYPIFTTFDQIGSSGVLFLLILLGANLSNGPSPGVEKSIILVVAVSRLVLLPLCAFFLIFLLKSYGIHISSDPLVEFIVLLFSAMPPSMSITALAEMNGFGQIETNTIMFYQYVFCTVTNVIWIMVFFTVIK